MRKFFWEGNSGEKLNHLVKWNKLTKAQRDGGLDRFKQRENKEFGYLIKMGLEVYVKAEYPVV